MEKEISLPSSIEFLINKLKNKHNPSPTDLQNFLKDSQIKEEDILPWADYNYSLSDDYGRRMIYQGENFEIMCMTWKPNHFSTIHDHGIAKWGIVKVFGYAEHASFKFENNTLSTVLRENFSKNTINLVNHHLIHQMGNPGDTPFISLHIYGDIENKENITENAKLYYAYSRKCIKVNGGVFYNLQSSNFSNLFSFQTDTPTALRDWIEYLKNIKRTNLIQYNKELTRFNRLNWNHEIKKITDDNSDKNGFFKSSRKLFNLEFELKQLNKFIGAKHDGNEDKFNSYAKVYDKIIGNPCYESFIKRYIQFSLNKLNIINEETSLISIGCGTGLIESKLIKEFKFKHKNIVGFDISVSMINQAKNRIKCFIDDISKPNNNYKKAKIAFSGLNVLQYLNANTFHKSIKSIANLCEDEGYFIGDFISQKHIHKYPHVISNENLNSLSIRIPRIKEIDKHLYQESSIYNLILNEELNINYEGAHLRYLPSISEVVSSFKRFFKQGVEVFDCISLENLNPEDEICPSTRYFIIAKK